MSVQVNEVSADYTNLITDAVFDEWLRFDGTDQDNVKPIILESAIREAENYCNATFGSKTFDALFTDFCTGKKYYLPFGKVIDVTSVKLIDKEGNETALTLNDGYYVGGLTNKYVIINKYNNTDNFIVRYTAGYSDPSTINNALKLAILQIASETFENRDDSVIGQSVAKFISTSRVKLAPFRNRVI